MFCLVTALLIHSQHSLIRLLTSDCRLLHNPVDHRSRSHAIARSEHRRYSDAGMPECTRDLDERSEKTLEQTRQDTCGTVWCRTFDLGQNVLVYSVL